MSSIAEIRVWTSAIAGPWIDLATGGRGESQRAPFGRHIHKGRGVGRAGRPEGEAVAEEVVRGRSHAQSVDRDGTDVPSGG